MISEALNRQILAFKKIAENVTNKQVPCSSGVDEGFQFYLILRQLIYSIVE